MTSDLHDPRSSPSPRARLVTDFLNAYLGGDIDRARSLVSEEFSFRAPLIDGTGSRETFFAGAVSKTSLIRDFRILRLWEDGGDVSTVYEIDVETPAGSASMVIHEWHLVRRGQLRSTVMTFDTAATAARLLHDALLTQKA